MSSIQITGALQTILKDPKAFDRYAKEAFGSPLLRDLAGLIDANPDAHIMNVNSNRMTYAVKRMTNRGVIDLKPFFKRSRKTKSLKGGGWYLRVPIQPTTRQFIKTFGRRKYDEMKQQFIDGDNTVDTISVNELFAKPNAKMNTLSTLSYKPKSNNVTRTRYTTSTGKERNTYALIRTVSSNSAPTSWVLNRNNMNEENTSQRLQDDIQALINNHLRQLKKLS